MFSSKKNKPIRVIHYEGIQEFSTNYPVTIELIDDNFIIKRIKPETTINLPLNRIKSFSAMPEKDFMLKYHGQAVTTTNNKNTQKYYLIVEYDKGTLVFWGTAKEYGKFIDLQYKTDLNTPKTIEL